MPPVTLASVAGAGGVQGLDTVASGPVRRYSRVWQIAVPTGGAAQGIEFPADTLLTLAFAPRDVSVLPNLSVERAVLGAGPGGELALTLAQPRRLRRLRLGSHQPGDQIALFRFDGPSRAEAPAALGSLSDSLGAEVDVSGAVFVLMRRRGGSDLTLGPNEVVEVLVEAPPLLPRIGVAIQGDPAGRQDLPPETDAAGAPQFPATREAGPALAAALTAAVARWQAGRTGADGTVPHLPDPLVIDLTVEADAPCAVTLAALRLDPVFERTGFEGAAGKRVLRPGTPDPRLLLPAGAMVLSAPLTLTPGGVAVAAPAVRRQLAATGLPGPSGVGLAVQGTGAAAARLALDAPVAARGIEVRLGGRDGPAAVALALWEDQDGLPGALLASSAAVAVASGAPEPVLGVFDAAVVAGPGMLWAGLVALSGTPVLALAAGGVDRRSAVALRGTAWSQVAGADGAALRLLVSTVAGVDPFPAVAGLSLALDSAPVALVPAGRSLTAELAPLLNARTGPAAASLSLHLGLSGGLATLDPPRLRYVLA